MLGGCLILLTLRFQGKIAVSTMKAKYVVMYMLMYNLIPLKRIVKTILETIGLDLESQSTIKSNV